MSLTLPRVSFDSVNQGRNISVDEEVFTFSRKVNESEPLGGGGWGVEGGYQPGGCRGGSGDCGAGAGRGRGRCGGGGTGGDSGCCGGRRVLPR
jgi:hypothetical protein